MQMVLSAEPTARYEPSGENLRWHLRQTHGAVTTSTLHKAVLDGAKRATRLHAKMRRLTAHCCWLFHKAPLIDHWNYQPEGIGKWKMVFLLELRCLEIGIVVFRVKMGLGQVRLCVLRYSPGNAVQYMPHDCRLRACKAHVQRYTPLP